MNTTPVKKILVPLDFSEFSEEALDLANGWAEALHASLRLLHVINLKDLYSFNSESIESSLSLENILRQKAQEELSKYARKAKAPCEIEIRLGTPIEEIGDCIEKNQIDLVIISTHGRSGIKHLLMGSVAEKVVRHSPCPVLTFRPKSLSSS